MQVLRSRRSMPTALKVLITIVSLAAGSLAAAYVWQNSNEITAAFGLPHSSSESVADPEPPEPQAEPAEESAQAASLDAYSSQDDISAAKLEPEPEPEDTAEQTGEAGNGKYAREALESAVPASAAPVDYSYFDDAIFFGDSISTGIPLYMKTVVPNAEVIAYQGVSPSGAATAECIEVDGVKMTMLEAAKLKGERKKVYVMLGANALDSGDEAFMNGYLSFMEEVKLQYPEAVVYIQSILPVTSNVNQVYQSTSINNERIAELNTAIRDMAVSIGVYYVDVAQGMVDENGFLPDEASPVDGMHLNPEYYYKWFDYLREHTVQNQNEKD